MNQNTLSKPRSGSVRLVVALLFLLIISAAAGFYIMRAKSQLPATGTEEIVETDAENNVIDVTVELPDSPQQYAVPVSGALTVWEVMQVAADTQGLQVSSKDYGPSMGIFIESLAGIPNTSEQYWQLYVNEQLSPVGVSVAKAQPGDVVTWKFEAAHENP